MNFFLPPCGRFILTLFGALVFSVSDTSIAQETRIPLTALGDYALSFTSSKALTEVPGPQLRAEVRYRAGEAFTLMLPIAAQRVEFLVPAGSTVEEDEEVASLQGPEVKHWLFASQAIEAQLDSARQRFEKNQPLFESGALSASSWADIQGQYYELRLEHEHREHVLRHTIVKGDWQDHDSPLSLVLLAPESGIINFNPKSINRQIESPLFDVIPFAAIRLQTEVPWRKAEALSAMLFDECRINISNIEQSASGFFVAAWSAGLTDQCYRPPGSVLSVTPLYQYDATAVPETAIFQWQQTPHVFVRERESLVPQPVELLGNTGGSFVIAAKSLSAETMILTESVSAAQGILIGLGGL